MEITLIQGKEQWLCFAGAAIERYPPSKVREVTLVETQAILYECPMIELPELLWLHEDSGWLRI